LRRVKGRQQDRLRAYKGATRKTVKHALHWVTELAKKGAFYAMDGSFCRGKCH
jgi:hypothetical protein